MDAFTLSPLMFAGLFFAGFTAGFVDSIAGGGGLISVPVLLSIGLPPQIALGTNKLQSSFGAVSSAYNYVKKGAVKLEETYWGIGITFIGAAMGTWTIQHIQPDFIRRIIPILLMVVFVYMLFSGRLGYESRKAVLSQRLFFFIFGLGLGFYDGFFGPGTGSFWTAAFIVFLGFDMTRAAGFTRVMNLTSNLVALMLFIRGNHVLYSVGIAMALGQIIGARTGSNLAIKKGATFIRPVFMSVVFLTILRLVYVNYV